MRQPFGRGIARIALLLCCAGSVTACASLPKREYGVNDIRWKGVHDMSAESVEACLATKERDKLTLRLGLGGTECGKPPFDESPPRISLWAWPWTEWPVYDPAIFDVDKKRILRWYQARGYYDTRLDSVRYTANGEQVLSPDHCTTESCKLTIHIDVTEGNPVLVRSIDIDQSRMLPLGMLSRLRSAIELEPGERFDEAIYDADKERLLEVLREHSYASAKVEGRVWMDRAKHVADVTYAVDTGPPSRYGNVWVEGNRDIPAGPIIDVADFDRGARYDQSEITDAERAVYALGVFSAVRIESRPRPGSDVVDLVIHVSPARPESWRLGVGMMSGTLTQSTSDELVTVPEWDVHLRAGYSNQNFLGGMRKLELEERPRLIFLRSFPRVPPDGARLGNTLTARFEQPRFPERRTVLFATGQWDVGPDPFYGFFRHSLQTKLGERRKFWQQRVLVELAIENDLYEILTSAPDTVSSYRLPFLEQTVRLDLRNDPYRPSRGVYVSNTVQEAFPFFGYGSWKYIRELPEARAYQQLFWHLVLAERIAFGAIFVRWADPALDSTSASLGPNEYRLRGGGANGNRGFAPGTLGAGITGGKRRWEGTLELRVPLASAFALALFFDGGDVSATTRMRFDHLNGSAGLGLRFYTAFAPIRFDAGWRIPGAQVIGGPEPPLHTGVLPSAVHLTIGEAF